ncbi:MAG TPA: prepilin-type N-terminal cleavage/methylation domain-containing protein [Planctomycetaceae bacterium]|jgi:prepilin-type N-terminal cleavage/methylation domain-containing protein|nr:prepilin-type N-terminal cleavage/methylation domain-containing protein [Planctomycetaceae bacterium]
MTRPTTSTRQCLRGQVSRRAGFSLIEILVVIGLIAFLTAAIVAVIPRVANSAKVAATKATIKKVDEMLNDRINGFRRWIQKQDQLAGPGNPPSYVTNSPFASAFAANQVQTRALAVKYAFRTYFPQAFSEFSTPITPGTNHTPVTESSECLYQFLSNGPLFDTEPPSAADLKAIETADTDGDGFPEIVDAWGQPLRFYRWPTRLVRPAAFSPTNPTTGNLPALVASAGPIDEIVQPSTAPPVLIQPSPLTLAMIGAAPRPSLPVWLPSHAYVPGAKVVSGNTTPTSAFSVIFQCVTGGTSGTGLPAAFATTPIGGIVSDGTSTPVLTWQVLLDPLSVDPDDPYGIAASLISEVPSGGSPLPALTPNTWSVPLIISCGPDGALGLFEPYDIANFGMLAQPQLSPVNGASPPVPTEPSGFNRDPMYDNITNHQQ